MTDGYDVDSTRLMKQGMSDTEADEDIKKLYDVADYQRATRPELNYEPDRFYDYIKSNSDYGFSVDAITSCIRRKTFPTIKEVVVEMNNFIKDPDSVDSRSFIFDGEYYIPYGDNVIGNKC